MRRLAWFAMNNVIELNIELNIVELIVIENIVIE